MLTNLKKGDVVAFGRRRVKLTDGTTAERPIEWIVLEVYENEREALLLSRWLTGVEDNGLTEEPEDAWEGSYLRWLLNDPENSFSCYRQWFTDEERARIIPCEYLGDCLFLPALFEIGSALPTAETRAARVQPGEVILWSRGKEAEGAFSYWLRDPGDDGDDYFCVVGENGEVYEDGFHRDSFFGVRPAVYVRLDA